MLNGSELRMAIYARQYDCPAKIYLPKLNTRGARKRCEICSNLTIKTPERHH